MDKLIGKINMKKITTLITLLIVIYFICTGCIATATLSNETDLSYHIGNKKNTDESQIKILFIGSSYFNYNDLPNLFEQLSISAGKQVYIDSRCINGWYLSDHANSPQTQSKIDEEQWDYVILQGCGINMAYPEYNFTPPAYSALVTLRDMIFANCATTKMIFCMPWAFEDGMTWYQNWTDTFEDMQILIYNNTLQYSDEIGFQIAPVGWAWYMVLEDQEYPLHYLHLSDWNHPSLRGSYVMACVVYSSIFLESSIGISYDAGLPSDEVDNFQLISSNTVLENLDDWNIQNINIKIIFNTTFGGANLDWGWSIQQTDDNGFIIGGETTSYGAGNFDAYLIKTDCYGNEIWNKTFGGSSKDGCRDIKQTQDGGYILTGYADSYGYPGHDYWIIKTDEFGQEQWSQIFGGPSSDASYAIIETSTGDFVFTGYSYSYTHGENDVWVVKTDNLGNLIWAYNYGGTGSEYGMSIVEADDGGYVIAGSTTSFGSGGTDVYLLKINSDGNLEWERTFGGSSDDWAGSIDMVSDGGFIIVGDTKSFGNGDYNVWMIKTNSNGIEEWNRNLGTTNAHETGYCVKSTSDNGFIVSGTTNIDGIDNGMIIKTNINGIIEWNHSFITYGSDIFYSICETIDNSYATVGYTQTYGAGDKDIWFVKIGNTVNQPPIPDFSYTPKKPSANETIQFIDESTDLDGYIINWTWDLGDGQIAYGAEINHQYSENDRYKVTLWVTDNNLTTVNISKYIEVECINVDLKNGWNLISLPSNITVDKKDIFIRYNSVKYDWTNASTNQNPINRSLINRYLFSWNNSNQVYGFSDILKPGCGYWLYAYVNCEMRVENLTLPPEDSYISSLGFGWNLFGLTFYRSINKIFLLINEIQWNIAVSNGWISDYVFGWNQTGQYYEFSETFDPGSSYWLYASQRCKLERIS